MTQEELERNAANEMAALEDRSVALYLLKKSVELVCSGAGTEDSIAVVAKIVHLIRRAEVERAERRRTGASIAASIPETA